MPATSFYIHTAQEKWNIKKYFKKYNNAICLAALSSCKLCKSGLLLTKTNIVAVAI